MNGEPLEEAAGSEVMATPSVTARPRLYSVYVIKLDANRMFARGKCSSPESKCVYVGQTAKSPEARFAQHKAGIRASGEARDFGIRLMPGHTKNDGPFDTEQQSLRAERRIGNRLRARGYEVWGAQGKKLMAGAAKGKNQR